MHAIDRSVKKETPSFLVSLAFQKLCNSALQSAPHRTAQKIHSSLIKFKARQWIERE
jgi:hypothetical protein